MKRTIWLETFGPAAKKTQARFVGNIQETRNKKWEDKKNEQSGK